MLLEVLAHGDLEVTGRLVDASNATLVGAVSLQGVTVQCVYKPTRGERPLWDFPDGSLGHREVASYELAAAVGWQVAPPTAWRDAGPLGAGMCQHWIEVDESAALVDVVPEGRVPQGWLHVIDAQGQGGRPVSLVHADDPRLRAMAVFDVVANNADRKGGHVLVDGAGALFGVDHGLTFHEEDKLRTVLWGWAGEPLGEELTADLDHLDELLTGWLGARLADRLSRREMLALTRRLDRLRLIGSFPLAEDSWPPLPWPAF